MPQSTKSPAAHRPAPTYGEYVIEARARLGAEPRPAHLATDAEVEKAAHEVAKLSTWKHRFPERYERVMAELLGDE